MEKSINNNEKQQRTPRNNLFENVKPPQSSLDVENDPEEAIEDDLNKEVSKERGNAASSALSNERFFVLSRYQFKRTQHFLSEIEKKRRQKQVH